jgi:hypothetical protein
LPLAFGKTVAAAKVVSHPLDKIAEPPRRLRAAIQAIDAKKFRPVRYGRSMRALAASYWRDSFCGLQRMLSRGDYDPCALSRVPITPSRLTEKKEVMRTGRHRKRDFIAAIARGSTKDYAPFLRVRVNSG